MKVTPTSILFSILLSSSFLFSQNTATTLKKENIVEQKNIKYETKLTKKKLISYVTTLPETNLPDLVLDQSKVSNTKGKTSSNELTINLNPIKVPRTTIDLF